MPRPRPRPRLRPRHCLPAKNLRRLRTKADKVLHCGLNIAIFQSSMLADQIKTLKKIAIKMMNSF
jgi:hypothetical protein